jgi:molybdenum cofactor cytidylyltransferase
MKFGPVPLAEAKGAILAHSHMTPTGKIAKGHVLTEADLTALAATGLTEVTAARLAPSDVMEDQAAHALAQSLVPDQSAAGLRLTAPHAGRVNLVATRPGIVALDPAAILALNRIDPSITLATLPQHARVAPGTLVGTVKIITYAVDSAALLKAVALAPQLSVRAVTRPTATLILTRAGEPDKLAQKGRDAIARRLTRLGMTLTTVARVPHQEAPLAEAIRAATTTDLILILTGAATSDLHDTAPAALRRAGGQVQRFGMPVDPGNLLFLGLFGPTPVIGLPGCTRSPALNGADWVLERLACGLTVTDDDIAAMGVGGLLKEIPVRGEPRERPNTPD